jgi:hypothetical protein
VSRYEQPFIRVLRLLFVIVIAMCRKLGAVLDELSKVRARRTAPV